MNIRYVGHILKVHMWIAVVICFQIARLAAREGYISIREYNLAVNRIVMEHSGVPEFVHAELVSGMFQRGHDGRCCKAQQKTDALDLVRKYHDGKVVVLSVADLHSLRSEKDRLLRCVREIFGDIGVKKMVVVFNGDVAPRAAIGYVKTDQDEGRTVFLIDEFRALLTELKGLFLDKHVDGHIIVNIGNHDVQSFEYFVQLLEICHEMNVPVLSHIPQAFDSDGSSILNRAKKIKATFDNAAENNNNDRLRLRDVQLYADAKLYEKYTPDLKKLICQVQEVDEYIRRPAEFSDLVQRANLAFRTIKPYHLIGNILFVGYCTSSLVIGGGSEGGKPIVLKDDWEEMLTIMGQDRKTCVIDDRTMQIIASAILGTRAGLDELYEKNKNGPLYLCVVAHDFLSTLPTEENCNGDIDRLQQVLNIILPAALEGRDLSRLAGKVFCGHDHISYMFGRVPFTVNGQTFLVDAVGSSGHGPGTVAIQVVGKRRTPVVPTHPERQAAPQGARFLSKMLEDDDSGQCATDVTPTNPDAVPTTFIAPRATPFIDPTVRGFKRPPTLLDASPAQRPPSLEVIQQTLGVDAGIRRSSLLRKPQLKVTYIPFVDEFNSISTSIKVQFVTCQEVEFVENSLPAKLRNTLRKSRIKVDGYGLYMRKDTFDILRSNYRPIIDTISGIYRVIAQE